MGLLGRLLALPLTGTIDGTLWVARQIAEQAERELYDEDRIRAALLDLELRHDLGEMTTTAFEEAEDALIEWLRIARARRLNEAS